MGALSGGLMVTEELTDLGSWFCSLAASYQEHLTQTLRFPLPEDGRGKSRGAAPDHLTAQMLW